MLTVRLKTLRNLGRDRRKRPRRAVKKVLLISVQVALISPLRDESGKIKINIWLWKSCSVVQLLLYGTSNSCRSLKSLEFIQNK